MNRESQGAQQNREQNREQNSEHRRRVHYSGKYPKKFEEKYKEQQPEKYADTVQHVMEKGSTPAGMHIPICVEEILSILNIQPGERGLDCTLGYGGHSSRMLEQLTKKNGQEAGQQAAVQECGRQNAGQNRAGHLTGLDIDPIESVKTEQRLREMGYGPDIFTVRHINFARIDEAAELDGKFDFVLADLGVSSMQIDNPERGFSYKLDGPLDLRLNPETGITAAERLKELEEDELAGMLVENADEPFAEEIAAAVKHTLYIGGRVDTTTALREIITETVTKKLNGKAKKEEIREAVKKSCQRTFQALRIDINHEYEVLYELLEKLPDALNEGGRAAILTFHSGEDRLVKKMFKDGKKAGLYAEIAEDVIRPSAEECSRNPRARSAKLRWAKK